MRFFGDETNYIIYFLKEESGGFDEKNSSIDDVTFNTQILSKQKNLDIKNNLLIDNEAEKTDLADESSFKKQDKSSSEQVKCRSAPVSPTHHSTGYNCRGTTTTPAATSFIYDMNLYNDSNHVLLNNQEEFNKSLMRIRKNAATDSYSSKKSCVQVNSSQNRLILNDFSPCNSSNSSFSSIKLEPLVINEEEKSVKNY